MFSLICGWTNGWVNNRDAGDLRRHWAHYDVIVMCWDFADDTFKLITQKDDIFFDSHFQKKRYVSIYMYLLGTSSFVLFLSMFSFSRPVNLTSLNLGRTRSSSWIKRTRIITVLFLQPTRIPDAFSWFVLHMNHSQHDWLGPVNCWYLWNLSITTT